MRRSLSNLFTFVSSLFLKMLTLKKVRKKELAACSNVCLVCLPSFLPSFLPYVHCEMYTQGALGQSVSCRNMWRGAPAKRKHLCLKTYETRTDRRKGRGKSKRRTSFIGENGREIPSYRVYIFGFSTLCVRLCIKFDVYRLLLFVFVGFVNFVRVSENVKVRPLIMKPLELTRPVRWWSTIDRDTPSYCMCIL